MKFNIFKPIIEKRAVTHDQLPFGSIDEVIRATQYESVQALENADVLTSLSILSSDISSLPLRVVSKEHENNEELEHLLNTEPNPSMSGKSLIAVLVVSSILNGNGYAEIERDENGVPIGLHYIPNDRVVNISKKSTSKYIKEIEYQVKNYGKEATTRKVKSQDMIHIKPFSTDGLVGKSPLLALKDDIKTQKSSKKFFQNFFESGTQSSGTINVEGDLNAEDKEMIRKSWLEANAGSDNAHKIIVLDNSMSYSPIKIDTEILKLINESKHSTIQVAKVLGLPLHKLKIDSPHQSLEQANSDYVINTLNSYISEFESEFSRKLFADKEVRKNYSIKFNTDIYKYSDSKTKIENIKAQFEMGLLSVNEARELLNMPSVEGGDRRIQSLNFIDTELINDYQMNRQRQNQTVLQGGDDK